MAFRIIETCVSPEQLNVTTQLLFERDFSTKKLIKKEHKFSSN